MTTEDFKRKLTAIFSADVAGYSRLMGDDEAATVKTLASYREVMASLIKQHRGRVVDSPGDNVLAEFVSVVDAVQCAVAVQKELQTRNAELPESRRMAFRIGINLGDVIDEEDRIYGDGVNIAARLEALADPGGICISKTAFDQIETKLPLGYEFLGEQEVKNIAKPVGAYRVLMDAEAAGKVIGEVRPKTKQLRGAAIGGVVVLILVAAALAIWNFYFRPAFEPASVEKMTFPLPDRPSIAVLPFVNMSEDKKQEYFSDGLTEEIITALSKIGELFVIASHSTFSYKGKQVKVRQVAEELGVRYVLEGSVRKSEERVRITAQLIDALKGHHLWAERYDRTVNDIFALQDDITKKIIIALQVKMMPGEEAPIYAKGTNSLDAYLKAMEGYWHYRQFTKEGVLRAQRLAQEAIAMDPSYAYAYHLLGICHRLAVWLGLAKSPQESLRSVIELHNKAISLDSSLAIAHAGLGYSLVLARQYDKAISAGERAMSLEPHSATILYLHASVLMFAGRHEEAITLFEEALRLNPKPNNNLYRHFGNALANTGRYEEAIALQKKAIKQNPNDIFVYMVMASVYMMAGHEAEARAAAKEVLRLNPNFSVAPLRKVRPDKDRTVAKRWCDTLREAGLPEKPPLPLPDKPSIAVLPFVNMSGDPEQEYFSDGITEDIITELSRFAILYVVARHSSFAFKGEKVDIEEVAEKLGVQYVVEGSVRRAGNQARITAQLIEAETGKHIWGERYDRELDDIFAVQDEVTRAIVATIAAQLGKTVSEKAARKPANNIKSYEYLLQANRQYHRFNPDDNIAAAGLYQKAIERDPQFSRAYAGLANTYTTDYFLGWLRTDNALQNGLEYAQKALEFDSNDALARIILAWALIGKGCWEEAELELDRVLTLKPGDADILAEAGNGFKAVGRLEVGIALLEEAIRLNPLFPDTYQRWLGQAYYRAGRYREAIDTLRAVRVDGWGYGVLAASFARVGELEHAHDALNKFIAQRQKELKLSGASASTRADLLGNYKDNFRTETDWQHLLEGLQMAGLSE